MSRVSLMKVGHGIRRVAAVDVGKRMADQA
jgi:hypothetical protein